MITIKIHSVVDVITNSSTVIFTNSNGCVEPVKELLAEILKMSDVDLPIEDVFDIVLKVDSNYYSERFDELYNDADDCEYYKLKELYPDYKDINNYKAQEKYIDNVVQTAYNGSLDNPTWFEVVEDDDDFHQRSTITITAKDSKYEYLAKLVHTVVYSTDHTAKEDR